MKHIHFFVKRMAVLAIAGFFSLAVFAQTAISNEAGLKAIANNLSGSYKLTADITLTDYWTPLGEFKGTLDGDGHIIYGLTIPGTTDNLRGLFSKTTGATVKNLGFENANINGNNDVAVIIGEMNGGTLEKCYVANTYVEGRDHVASLVGKLQNQAVLQNCYAAANIYSRSTQAGGLVGVLQHNGTQISKSYFAGIVRSVGARPAGIAALNDNANPTVDHCVNLSSYLLGNSVIRIVHNNNKDITLTENYSISSTIVNTNSVAYTGNPVGTGDINYGTTKLHGANIPESFGGDAGAKAAAFYESLGWDFTDTWKIVDGYPVLKWQTPRTTIVKREKDIVVYLKAGDSYDLKDLISGQGLTLTYSTASPSIAINNGVVTPAGAITTLTTAIVAVKAGSLPAYDLKVVLFPTETLITTAAELRLTEANPTGNFKLTNDIALTGTGASLAEFKGTFDGNGHVISGLKISASGFDQQGLFSKTTGATIKNLGIENANVVGGSGTGPLIGEMVGGLVDQCYVANSYSEGNDHTGGLVGRAYTGATITNSYSNANVYARANQAGGLVGCAKGNGAGTKVTISKSFFSGIVESGKRPNGIVSTRDDANVVVEYSVNLATALILRTTVTGDISPNFQGRIISNDNNAGVLTGNYSLESTLFGLPAAIASTSSDFYGTTKPLGENITAAQAKDAGFYSGIGWDFTDIWQILADGYPVLKWQTTPVNTSILKLEPYSLTKETSIDLKKLVSSHGLTLSFAVTSDDIEIADGVVTSENGAFPPIDIPVTASVNADFNLITPTVVVKLFPSGIIDIADAETFLLISQYPDMSYRLTADIDLTDVPFSGIGTTAKPFTGVFDGNGHIIKGAKYEAATEGSVGLFRETKNATIKKLGLEGARFIGNADTGGFIGKSSNTLVEESYVADSYIEGRDHAGSIIGGLRDGSIIRNSYSTARVHSREHQAGGLSGTIQNGLIENSYYSGIVSNVGNRAVGIGGYQDNSGAQPSQIQVKNSVNLAPYILSNNYPNANLAATRIFDNIGGSLSEVRPMQLTNNYSLSTSRLGKPDYSVSSTVAEDDAYYGTDKRNGANVSPEDAHTEAFYRNTLGWDFDAVWTILADGYPVLTWQTTAPIASTVYTIKEKFVLKTDETIDLSPYVISSRGLNLTFTPNNEAVVFDGAVAAIGEEAEAWDASIVTVSKAANADFAAVAGNDLTFTVFPVSPIAIANEEQLDILHSDLSGDFVLANDITLTSDWTPTGTFTGTFDGQGHILSGLHFEDANRNSTGFFGQTDGAIISNLGIKAARIKGNADVGAIVGNMKDGLIQSCFVSADSYIEGRDHTGAIAGAIRNGGAVTNSYAESRIHSREYQAGGIAGILVNGHVENAYFAGKVTSGGRASGIVSYLDINNETGQELLNTIENSVNLATELISGSGSSSTRIMDDNGNPMYLDNNYSLSTTLLGRGEDPTYTIPDTDEHYGADDLHGANIPEGDENAKKQAFYETTLGWDFSGTWIIDEGNAYPVLSVFYSDDATLSVPNVEEGATSGVKVYSKNNTVYAAFNGNAPIRLYSVTGQLIHETVAVNSYQHVVKQGVYILSVQDKVYKVIVK